MSITEVILLIFFIVSTVGWILSIQYRKSILLYLANAFEEKAEAYDKTINEQSKQATRDRLAGKNKYLDQLYRDNDIKYGKAQGFREARKYILYELQDYS